MKPTALGNYIGIYQHGTAGWVVIAFNSRGNWQAAQVCGSRREAQKARAAWRRLHRSLAKDYAARKRGKVAR